MVQNDYCYGHFCGIRNQVRLPTLSLSCGCIDAACTSPRKLSLLPLIASTTTEACSLPLWSKETDVRPLRGLCYALPPLHRLSRFPFHSIRVYSPTILATPFVCRAPTLFSAPPVFVFTYIAHFLPPLEWPFCQDILITGVSPDPTTCSRSGSQKRTSSSQSRFSYFHLFYLFPYCHTGDNTYLSVNHIENVILILFFCTSHPNTSTNGQ